MELVLVLTMLLVGSTIGLGVYAIKNKLSNNKIQKFLGINMGTFLLLMIGAAIFLISGNHSFAAEATTAAATVSTGEGMKYIGAGLSTGMACIGAGIAVGAASAAAIGAISENPKLLGRTIIFVGLSEGIALYGLIISILILN